MKKKGRIKRKFGEVKEKIKNIPNSLTLIRAILSICLVAMVLLNHNIQTIIIVFIIAAITDFADGYIARKYNQVTNFGRRFDMIADRMLMLSVIITLLLYMLYNKQLTNEKLFLIFLIMSREVISAPVFLVALFLKKARLIPHARFSGKTTTLLQGITFPLIVFTLPFYNYMAYITCISGIISACYFLYDSLINPNNAVQVKLDKYYKNLYKNNN